MSTRPPVNDWATDFDHLDPRWIENPYPIWQELRETCPVAHTDRYVGKVLHVNAGHTLKPLARPAEA